MPALWNGVRDRQERIGQIYEISSHAYGVICADCVHAISICGN